MPVLACLFWKYYWWFNTEHFCLFLTIFRNPIHVSFCQFAIALWHFFKIYFSFLFFLIIEIYTFWEIANSTPEHVRSVPTWEGSDRNKFFWFWRCKRACYYWGIYPHWTTALQSTSQHRCFKISLPHLHSIHSWYLISYYIPYICCLCQKLKNIGRHSAESRRLNSIFSH